MSRPIILIHRGCPDYLKIVLAQAREYNPDSPLVLLGDSSNAHLIREIPGLEHEPLQCDSGDSGRFAKVYQHQSGLDENFERICFQRWILLRDLMRRRNWDRLLHLDSDVLLYSDVAQAGKRFDDSAMSLAPWFGDNSRWCGHTCFINHPDTLDQFVDFMFKLYTTDEGKRLRDKSHIEDGYAISDMTCLGLFRGQTSLAIADLTQIVDGAVFDNYITTTQGIYEKGSRLFRKDIKRIFFKNGVPYCRLKDNGESICFLSIHFHGNMKYMIRHFAKGKLGVSTFLAMICERMNGKLRQYLRR